MASTRLLTPNKYLGTKWYPINTWKSYLEKFSLHSPDNNIIIKNYQEAKQMYYDIVHSELYKELLQELMMEDAEGNIIGLSLDEVIEQTINFIQSQGNLYSYIKGKTRMRVDITQAEQIRDNWQSILDKAEKEKWASVNIELIRISNLIKSLDAAIAQSSNGKVNMGKVVGNNGNMKGKSVANSVQGTLNSLRGKLLEEKAVEFLSKNLPEDFKNTTNIYQTGSILVNGTSIKEDIMLIFDDLEIVNERNEVIYTFSNGKITATGKAPNKETVVLTEEQYKKLQDAAIGMSAKTSTRTTSYHSGLNIKEFLDSVSENDPTIFQLIHMYQLGVGEEHTLYQKYAISKKINYIIGEKNIFMVSKGKIIPTYLFIEKLTARPLGFKSSSLPKRGENAPLNTDFGNTDITGISSS